MTKLPGKVEYSPYNLITSAKQMMLKMILDFPPKKEKKVIEYINGAETYPYMSSYQVQEARIILLDLYISHRIFGSAYDLCKKILDNNPRAPVKKKLATLESLKDTEDFIYSIDQNTVDPSLCFSKPSKERVYDPDFEQEIADRLDRIGEPYKSTFYKNRHNRSYQEDIWELESMEENYAYYNKE